MQKYINNLSLPARGRVINRLVEEGRGFAPVTPLSFLASYKKDSKKNQGLTSSPDGRIKEPTIKEMMYLYFLQNKSMKAFFVSL